MSVPNQKKVRINKHRLDYNNDHYVAYETEFQSFLFQTLTYGAFKVYGWLCSQVPDMYDGKQNPKNIRRSVLELSPAAIKKYCGMDEKTCRNGINQLIELGFLVEYSPGHYLFDDMPMQYRTKTPEEAKQIEEEISNEQVYAMIHAQQIKNAAAENPEHWSGEKKYSWQD